MFLFEDFKVLFAKIENIKKPIETKKNLNAKAEKGSLQSIIGFVVIKAEDKSNINISVNSFIINYNYINFT